MTGAPCSDWSQTGVSTDGLGGVHRIGVASAYLSGPMTGSPGYNYEAFHFVAARLRAEGWRIFSPAENPADPLTASRAEFMRLDIQALAASEPKIDAILLLYGWEASQGVRLELAIAEELGLVVGEVSVGGFAADGVVVRPLAWSQVHERLAMRSAPLVPFETPLEEAQRLVHGDRGDDYGHPLDDFTRTAAIWNGILHAQFEGKALIRAEDVAMMMIGLKLSRQQHRPKRDNVVDTAGYAETLHMVIEERARRDREAA